MPHPDSFPSPNFQPHCSPRYKKPLIPKLTVASYELNNDQVDKLLIEVLREQLNLSETAKITLYYKIENRGGDMMDRFPGTPTVVGLRVDVVP